MALPIHVALVSDESNISLTELALVAAALQKQVLRDFGPIWQVQADIAAFEKLENVPLDYWPIIIKDDIGAPGAAGYHQDHAGQPFALVQYAGDWSLTASHELLEMLGDPFGRRLIAGDSPIAGQGRVQFLVEVSDPSEAVAYSYQVNGITVSDFYTPDYFDPQKSGGVRYSFTNAITEPRQVLPGGYLSWCDPATQQWWQRTWFGGDAPADHNLGRLDAANGNLRCAIDRITAKDRLRAMQPPATDRNLRALLQGAPAASFTGRAEALRDCVRKVTEVA